MLYLPITYQIPSKTLLTFPCYYVNSNLYYYYYYYLFYFFSTWNITGYTRQTDDEGPCSPWWHQWRLSCNVPTFPLQYHAMVSTRLVLHIALYYYCFAYLSTYTFPFTSHSWPSSSHSSSSSPRFLRAFTALLVFVLRSILRSKQAHTGLTCSY